MDPETLQRIVVLWAEAIKNAKADPLRKGWVPENWKKLKGLLDEDGVDNVTVFGGNRCYCPLTTYIDDPFKGRILAADIDAPFHVWAWDGSSLVPARAERPFQKGHEEMLEVSFSNGERMTVTQRHRFLTPYGFRELQELRVGSRLCGRMDASLPCIQSSCALTDSSTTQDFRSDCLGGLRSYGGPLRRGSGTVPNVSPLSSDALQRIHSRRLGGDVAAGLPCNSPPSSIAAFSWSGFLPFSTAAGQLSDYGPSGQQFAGALNSEPFLGQSSVHLPSIASEIRGQGSPLASCERSQLLGNPCCSQARQRFGGWSSPLNAACESGPSSSQDIEDVFIVAVKSKGWGEVWDHHVPGHENYLAHGIINHNSSKTTASSYLVVNALIENPGTRILCWSQSEKISNMQQQPAVYQMLPPEFRKKQKDAVTKINYSVANGFTDNSFILPNGSACYFWFYTQFQQDPGCIEGVELGWKGEWNEVAPYTNIGNWFDEYLGDPALMNQIEERLSTRDAKGLMTFTPIHQYTETVREILEGAQTLETLPVYTDKTAPEGYEPDPEILWEETIPYIQAPRKSNSRVIYFATRENKFHNYERTKRNLQGKPKQHVKMKVFGVPSKVGTAKFPKFSRAVNVLEPGDIPELGTMTLYHVVDPAGDKPWSMAWIGVDRDGTWFIYREWPDEASWGPWAEWRDGRWQPGEAATGECCGYGYDTYRDLLGELEGTEDLFERIIDPRMGAASTPGKEETTSIIGEMAERGIVFNPAPGLQEAEGIQAIQDLMDYDTLEPVSQLNRPKFYVSSRCGNIIRAIASYDTAPGKVDLKHPWKDFIDCYDEETDLLTEKGWFRFADLPRSLRVATANPEGVLEWQVPDEYISRSYEGDMIAMSSRSIDFKVTPNHRMVVHPQKSNRYAIRKACEMFRQDSIPVCTKGVEFSDSVPVELWDGKLVDSDDWGAFMGWFLSEGSCAGSAGGKIQVPGRGYAVMISQCRQANPHHCVEIEGILDSMGLNWAYRGRSYHISCKALWERLIPLGTSSQKYVPEEAFGMPRSSLAAMYDALIKGDGWRVGGKGRYASVSKELVSGIQGVMQIIGLPHTQILTRPAEKVIGGEIKGRAVVPRRDQYWLQERTSRRSGITTQDKRYLPERVPYSGQIHCVRVPNGTLVVRRGGKVMVCGNCIRYGAVSAIDYVPPENLAAVRTAAGGY